MSGPFIGPQRRHLVLLFHDESTYHSNEDQGWMWAEKENQLIVQLHVRESILIDLLIVVVQPLDAVVRHKNVQKPLGNGQPWTQNLLSP